MEVWNKILIKIESIPTLYLFIAIGCAVLFFLCLFFVLRSRLRKKKKRSDEMHYRTIFLSQFELTGNIQTAWEITRDHFDKKSRTYDVIQLALYYLDHSILRDYETAMKKIEEYLTEDETKEVHKTVLNKLS